eukprot:2234564-Karenia_brevis.AAC.1
MAMSRLSGQRVRSTSKSTKSNGGMAFSTFGATSTCSPQCPGKSPRMGAAVGTSTWPSSLCPHGRGYYSGVVHPGWQ